MMVGKTDRTGLIEERNPDVRRHNLADGICGQIRMGVEAEGEVASSETDASPRLQAGLDARRQRIGPDLHHPRGRERVTLERAMPGRTNHYKRS